MKAIGGNQRRFMIANRTPSRGGREKKHPTYHNVENSPYIYSMYDKRRGGNFQTNQLASHFIVFP